MSAQYDYARPAKQAYTLDTARLHMASKTASYLPPSSTQTPSRRMPMESASLPQTSWLSGAAEFTTSPLSQSSLGVGLSVPAESILSSSMSDIGEPISRSIHRARSRDHLLHSNPTPPHPSASGTSRSRHTPSPSPSPSQTLHGARSFSSSHKSSGFSSDRDASGHLDLKRLMSKPAKQKQAPSGSISLPSDSERSGDPSTSRVRSPSYRAGEPSVSRPPLSKSATASREKLSLNVSTAGVRSSSAPGHGRTSSSPDRRPFPADTAQGGPADRPRNVLRRRPSARSNPATPVTQPARAPAEDAFPAPRAAHPHPYQQPGQTQHPPTVVHDDTVFSLYTRPVTSPTARATARPMTSPRTKAAPSPSPRSPQVPAGLTPAGAVALAYKQQEQRREELAETASFNERLPLHNKTQTNSLSAASRRRQESSSGWSDDHEGSGAYYTVFGSSSGRLVAVGSPEDDLVYGGIEQRSVSIVNGHGRPATSSGGAKSLSRKVSGSFKKVAGSMKREREVREAPPHGREEWLPYDGTNAGHGRHPITLDTSVHDRNGSPSPVKYSPGPKSSASPQEDGYATRMGKARPKDEELSPGGRWWKLMKRISTGGLRDKYQQQTTEPPPPVPALPESLIPPSPSRMTMDISASSRAALGEDVNENGVLLRRFMQSRASMSGVRPSFAPPSKASSGSGSSRPSTSAGASGPSTTRPSTGTTAKSRASISTHRPSTATRSSSPASEPASTSFFHSTRTPSTRSSFSSLGEEVPPVPKKNVGQYIVPPSELSRMTRSSSSLADPPASAPARTSGPAPPKAAIRQPGRASTAPPADAAARRGGSTDDDRRAGAVPSLPLPPPRRATTGGSPVAPSFSVEDTINDLMPPQPSAPPPLTEFGVMEPPPRPKRSSRRGPPPAVEVPPRAQSMSAAASTAPREPATPRALPQVRVDTEFAHAHAQQRQRRPSTGALSYASTARQVSAPGPASASAHTPASASLSSPASAASRRSPLTFRELESPRQKLTEQEKADKWADLLERSARAGGTLRVGESHLMSDEASVSMLHLSDSD